jgi:hypothetical protein
VVGGRGPGRRLAAVPRGGRSRRSPKGRAALPHRNQREAPSRHQVKGCAHQQHCMVPRHCYNLGFFALSGVSSAPHCGHPAVESLSAWPGSPPAGGRSHEAASQLKGRRAAAWRACRWSAAVHAPRRNILTSRACAQPPLQRGAVRPPPNGRLVDPRPAPPRRQAQPRPRWQAPEALGGQIPCGAGEPRAQVQLRCAQIKHSRAAAPCLQYAGLLAAAAAASVVPPPLLAADAGPGVRWQPGDA